MKKTVKKKHPIQDSKKSGQSAQQIISKQSISKANSAHLSGLSSRTVAVKIVQDCVESGLSLSSLLPKYLESIKTEQRPLAQEISFGVLRWYHRLSPLLSMMLSKPLKGKKKSVHYLLLVGLYQLVYLDKAEYAIVAETVNACNELQQAWAKGLVNAILRRFLREKEALFIEMDKSYASRFSYPEWLITRIKKSWNKNKRSVESILDAGNQRPPMTLRLNQKLDIENYLGQLVKAEIAFSRPFESEDVSTEYNPYTVILDKPVAVEKLPLFAEGALSVQDGAPQFSASLLSPQPGEYILDACAAPGGKTMHLFEQQPLLESVVALDVSSERLKRVEENSIRLKIPSEKLRVMTADAASQDWWDGQLFDRILLDAPCSATGVIRRHPDIKILRRSDDISALTQLQAKILDNLWSMLKPGGVLLYATCSILREENDHQISSFIQRQEESLTNKHNVKEIVIEASWGDKLPFGRQILPGDQNMDGFYYALLKKETNREIVEE
ncbi:MAG: 16S rRNA (cytosine(967)-C(5))-methyltransferase RsmB [Gammaproteobacteria bacterium]|nr:16S rRNA (cytosine(967)-C(5))-methyltransferase RsmB [Gammaproteobacteria bacterium]